MTTKKNSQKHKIKIFIGPSEIAGYYGNLHYGFKKIGVDATYVTFREHPFGYKNESCEYWFTKLIKHLSRRKIETPRTKIFQRLLIIVSKNVIRFIAFIFFLLRFDVFIFGFGLSLLPKNHDLMLIKMLGKKIIFVMGHGSELRPPYINGAYQNDDGSTQPDIELLKSNSSNKKKCIQKIEKFADFVLGAPFSSTHFAEHNFVNLFAFGIPYQSTRKYKVSDSFDSVIRILHSPSLPAVKGSKKIRYVMKNLKKKGFMFEYIEIQGRSNYEVLDEIEKCDFIIDQIYSDTPLASFATEAAWFGKPAVVGGYGLEKLRKYVPADMYPPSHICHPDDLESAVEQLIMDVNYRRTLGVAAQTFVRDKWSAELVAEKYLKLIGGDIPENWWLDPKDVIYLQGCGQSEEQTKENIRRLVKAYGVKALQLSHRPHLEQAFLEFAGIKSA